MNGLQYSHLVCLDQCSYAAPLSVCHYNLSFRIPSNARLKAKQEEWNNSSAVDAFLQKFDHPLKPTVEAIRSTILSANPHVTEGIKWNSPSFYSNGWFATANAKGKEVIVVFHMGAKVKDNSTAGTSIKDSSGLLEWAAKERALVGF